MMTSASSLDYHQFSSNKNRFTVLRLKLTDSALQNLENYQKNKDQIAKKLTIRLNNFDGTDGCLTIPNSKTPKQFNLSVSKNTYAEDCLEQKSLIDNYVALGVQTHKIQVGTSIKVPIVNDKMTGNSLETLKRKSDTYGKTVDNKLCLKEIPNTAIKNEVASKPLRERIMHLLAVGSYQRPELIIRLNKDGRCPDTPPNLLTNILQDVANLSRDGSYTLQRRLFSKINSNWPGYSDADRIILEKRRPEPEAKKPRIDSTCPIRKTNLKKRLEQAEFKKEQSNNIVNEKSPQPNSPNDFTKKYVAIENDRQYEFYIKAYKTEYDVYIRLHSFLSKHYYSQFEDYQRRMNVSAEGSEERQRIYDKIINEYDRLQNDDDFGRRTTRFFYLHSKLGHIRSLIKEYESNQQLKS